MPIRREVKNTFLRRAVNFTASTWLGVLILTLFVPFMLVAAFLPQGLPDENYVRVLGEETFSLVKELGLNHVFHSWIFYTLLVLFLVNVLLCTVKRIAQTGGPMRLFPSFFAHFFLIFLTGSFIQSSITSAFREIPLRPGVPYEVKYPFSETRWAKFLKERGKVVEDMPAGITLTLIEFREIRECWRGKEAILNWESIIEVKYADGRVERKVVAVNRPLKFGALKFYMWAFDVKAVLEVAGGEVLLSEGDAYGDVKVLKIYPGGLACSKTAGPAVKLHTSKGEKVLTKGQTAGGIGFKGIQITSVMGMKYDPAVSFIKGFAFIFNFLLLFAFVERLRKTGG